MSQNAGSRSVRTVTPRNIYETKQESPLTGAVVLDATYAYDGRNTSYESELREGTILARITSSGLGAPCKCSYTNGQGIAATALVVDDARAFKAGDTVSIKSPTDVLKLKDDDNAASTGVAIYVHVDELDEKCFGHLESVTAGNADFYLTSIGGAKLIVEDDDAAATGGHQLYFDEDAANPDERFLAAISSGKDCFITMTDGRLLRIKYHATPSSVGVAVYGDDDAATTTDRFLFVSPTNVSGVQKTDNEVGMVEQTALVTLASGLTVSSVNYSSQTLTIDTSSTWADECFVVASGALAGLELARGVMEEVVDLWDADSRAAIDKSTYFVNGNARLKTASMLGDITACRAYPGNFIDKLEFYTSGVRV